MELIIVMMNCPKISIITVTYNAEEIIENTILSIINQTYEPIEYIIIDGGSTDNTVSIIKKYHEKIDFWSSELDSGIYNAMNKGIKYASGVWINFMNAGDILVKNNVIASIFDQPITSDIIYGNTLVSNKETGKKIIVEAGDATEKNPMPFCHQSVFVRTDILKQNLFDERYKICSDKDFFFKIYKQSPSYYNTKSLISQIQMVGFSTINRTQNLLEANDIYVKNEIRSSTISSLYVIKIYIEKYILKLVQILRRVKF